MGLAFTDAPVSWVTALDGSTKSNLIAALHAVFVLHWPSATVTGGRLYTLNSPQDSLVAKLRVWDDGSTGRVSLRMESFDGERVGYRHTLTTGDGRTFQAVVGVCQAFISVAGSFDNDGDSQSNVFCCGVPWIADSDLVECTAEGGSGSASEAWWSCGDRENNAEVPWFPSFRNFYECRLSSACWNGIVTTYPAMNTPTQCVRMFPFVRADESNGAYVFGRAQTCWADGSPLYTEPLIGWGGAAGEVARIRGEIWDAVHVSLDRAIDFTETLTYEGRELTFVNFSHSDASNKTTVRSGTYYGCLYLLVSQASNGGANYFF